MLALVAQGLSNRQIGEKLYISGKTVSVHISNLLAKLGVSGRAEAVVGGAPAWADRCAADRRPTGPVPGRAPDPWAAVGRTP